jgi:hypothetical protein
MGKHASVIEDVKIEGSYVLNPNPAVFHSELIVSEIV